MKSVLVDSSVWISFFRGDTDILDRLVEEDLICTNDIILSELIPAIRLQGKKELEDSMLSIPKITLSIDWDLIRKMQFDNLKNGVNKVGISDLIILQQVMDHNLELLTQDKHFMLMQNYMEFSLFE